MIHKSIVLISYGVTMSVLLLSQNQIRAFYINTGILILILGIFLLKDSSQ